MSNKQFDKGYEPHEVEKRWYAYWEKEQLFAAEDQSPQAKLFHCYSAAQCNRRPSHGTCIEQHPAGYFVPVSAA